ncbi:glycerol-3-phosphate 1-O-acyltransferase PlsY [Thalassospira marina]|uniref:Glycerol-3-phosphate acyltransferase n=1 Tax=Thalassospira marina TaxID=2048283 RepID=A0ABM6Q8I1_9PROT|nr:glycerol-3-phosphate 1-O-acyltransferase PlsY [Thalassospira marina]AUG52759.1 acyl-phosphate glycerol 3-phosphate acyltransferase [Thalassospira marina]
MELDPAYKAMLMSLQVAAVCGYLLGSIPFGLVLTRMAGLGDIRKIGSGNIGATNVLRTGNKFLALLTLIGDSGKGAAAALLFTALYGPEQGIFAGAAAVIGHMFPLWLRFKGGKGVATTLGTLLAVNWIMGVIACLAWLIMALIFRISSLSALVALAVAPLAAFYVAHDIGAGWLGLFLAVIVWGAHHTNIRRLLNGTEPKIGDKKKAAAAAEAETPESSGN